MKSYDDDSLKVFRPSYLKTIMHYYILLFLIVIILFPICLALSSQSNFGSPVLHLFLGCLVSVISCPIISAGLRMKNSITISSKAVTGPKFLAYGRTGFPLHQIDLIKSQERNIFEKIFGIQILVSTDGEKMFFDRPSFNQEDIEEIERLCKI